MWYGKLSVIIYVFCFAVIFMTLYMNQIFNDPYITNNVTFSSLNSLIGSFSFNQQINTSLVFGDFYNTYLFLSSLMTGQNGAFNVFGQVFGSCNGSSSGNCGVSGIANQSGFAIDMYVTLLATVLFDSATVFFLLYIISFRSI